MTPKPSTFELRATARWWGEHVALAGIDLRIEPGERVALLGPSGSGKTTLLRLLMASLRSSAGTIGVDGRAIEDMHPREIRTHRRRCALVDQDALMIPRLSVHANVLAGCVAAWPWWRTIASMLWTFDRDKVHKLLDRVGLAGRQWDRADLLSGGQRQRVAIARALAGDATVILADEPTASLDPTTAAEVMSLLVQQTQATLIISTHRASQVMGKVDRIIGVREGKILFDEAAATVDDALLDRLYKGSGERN